MAASTFSKFLYFCDPILQLIVATLLWPIILIAHYSKTVRDIYFKVLFESTLFVAGENLDVFRTRLCQKFAQEVITAENKEELVILEIGPGCGDNFKFYPPKTTVNTLDSNGSYHSDVCQEATKYNVKFGEFGQMLGTAEKMDWIANDTFDIILMTFSLCCIKDKERALNEIYRVLKPGGKYFLVEFGKCNNNRFLETFQKVFSRLHKFVFLGCTAPWQSVRTILELRFRTNNLKLYDIGIPALAFKTVYMGYVQKDE